jgi:hypothetical protein
MDNPFLKRATEFYRDEEAFLAVISPEPIRYFLLRDTKRNSLFEKLVNIRGTPGSGKTTMAKVFEFPALSALLRNRSIATYGELVDTMTACGALVDGELVVLGCRLPLETDYREVWEFEYPEHVKVSLTSALVQARAVLGWLRHLQQGGYDLAQVRIHPKEDAAAKVEAIGGTSGDRLLERARAVERALYRVVGALVPPELGELDDILGEAYRPFDVIEHIVIISPDGRERKLRPLVILDDAHALHPTQFRALQRILIRREIRVARWILARFDVLHPKEAFEALTEDRPDEPPMPGVTASRDYLPIMLQSGVDDRRRHRVAFRRMAMDMASRYLLQMEIFRTRNLGRLENLLKDEVAPLSKSKLEDLAEHVDTVQRKFRISGERRAELSASVEAYTPEGLASVPPELKLAMLSILMHRMQKRGQAGLFDSELPEPASKLPKVDATVYGAARIHLLHRYDRPYYVGIDDVCDASSENAEQFLRLAAELVEISAVNIIRGKSASLDAATQHDKLRKKATHVVQEWDFPRAKHVRKLVEVLAEQCLKKSLEPNAPLGPGANAYGILQEEFEAIPDQHSDLAQLLQAAIANNALTVVPRYNCKNKEWCLLELGGIVILRHGLTLKRGGFLEGSASALAGLAREGAS